MTEPLPMDRFEWQRRAVEVTDGPVLNIGCHEDGAGLKAMDPRRVINCDIAVQPGYSYEIDSRFDARERWPFDDGYAELAVIADVMEHWYDNEILAVLREAGRVCEKLCVTVPYDDVLGDEIIPDAQPRAHCNTIGEDHLRWLLWETGWEITDFEAGSDANWSPLGFLVNAVKHDERSDDVPGNG